MKPRKREIEIFNMSVLDLLTGALGAFCFLTLALFPLYFSNIAHERALAKAKAALQLTLKQEEKIRNQIRKPKLAPARSNAMPPFASGRLTALDQRHSHGGSCGVLRVLKYNGPGGAATMRILPVDVIKYGLSTQVDLFMTAPGQYHLTVEALLVTPQSQCDLMILLRGKSGPSSTARLTRPFAKYVLTAEVKRGDLVLASAAKQ